MSPRQVHPQLPVNGVSTMVRKALVVEDEAETGTVLCEILRHKGYEPTHLLEGTPAIPWTRQHQPELILLDLMLPDADGYKICEDLKLDKETNLIPTIMVTALGAHKDKVHGLQVGANSYLTKPFTVDQLSKAIDEVVAWKNEIQKHGTDGEVHFQLQSDTKYLEELNDLLSAMFLFSGLSQPPGR